MDPIKSSPLTRADISGFISSPRGIRSFEAVQGDVQTVYDTLASAPFLVVSDEPSLGAERVLTPVTGEIVGTDGGANAPYTLGLADTAVVPGSYGDNGGAGAAKFVSVTVDKKGRLTSASTFSVTTANIPEGSNLYFTTARARAAISGTTGISYNTTTGVIAPQSAGTYGAPTGTVSRATFATYSAPTISASYTQSEVQAIADALQVVSRTLAALITDLKANGNLT